jgi:hypothetical protein
MDDSATGLDRRRIGTKWGPDIMSKFLRLAAVAATTAAFALAAPASAAPVGVTGVKPVAKARIIRPLTLSGVRDLDFGTIVLGSVNVAGEAVSLSTAGVLGCGTGGLTCSGTTLTGRYNVTGTQGQTITVAGTNSTLTGSNGGTLTFVPALPANFSLPNSGAPGQNFDVGGSITIFPTTADGVYSGDMEVTVDYL